MLERIIKESSNENDIILDAFCGCGTALVAAQNLNRQWIGIDISPTACRVMAKRLQDICRIREDEKLWKSGRGFVVRDLPWTEHQLRKIPPFEFENWAVIALGGIPNKTPVGRPDIDKFEAAMIRTKRKKGFFVGFDFTSDTMTEINRFFRTDHTVIVPLTVREILNETIAQRLA